MPVGCGEGREGRNGCMARTQRTRCPARCEEAGDGVLQDRHLAIQHRHIDLHAGIRALALVERGDDADGGEEAGGDIADGRADAGGRTARMAGDAHDAAHGLDDHVIGRAISVRAAMAEARGRGVDQARMAFMQHIPAIAQFFHGAGTVVLYQHIGLGQQPIEDGAVGILLQIDGDGFLAAVEGGEIAGDAVDEGTVAAGIVALGRLDLDDACAQIGQQHGAIGACQDPGQVQDDEAGEGSGNSHGIAYDT